MVPGPSERALEILDDIDARLAGLEVGYSEANATAAKDLVEQLGGLLDGEPEEYVALRDAVADIVAEENADRVGEAKAHADELKRQITAQVEEDD